MNEMFYKKLYTVAFRLTGDEKAACELTTKTLSLVYDKTEKKNYISIENFKLIVLKLIELFIEQYNSYSSISIKAMHNIEDNIQKLQRALLQLNPASRAIIIWKDLLGYKLDEILHVMPISKEELYAELNSSYRILKEDLNAS